MGKIVRAARFENEKYLVAIPTIDVSALRELRTELDERYAAPLRAVSEIPQESASDPEPAPAPPTIDWKSLHRSADAVIDRAAQDAQGLLAEAATRARELIALAQARVEEIESEARRAGHDDGVDSGRTAVEAEMAEMLAALHELISSARKERHTIIDSAEGELVSLAMTIAERVVHQHIDADPSVVLENVRSALTRLVTREVVTLRVHPADLALIREHRDSLVSSNDVERLRVIEDQRVDRGGVVLETESGTLDAKIGTQLREARKALHGDETIALAPSGESDVLHTPAQAS